MDHFLLILISGFASVDAVDVPLIVVAALDVPLYRHRFAIRQTLQLCQSGIVQGFRVLAVEKQELLHCAIILTNEAGRVSEVNVDLSLLDHDDFCVELFLFLILQFLSVSLQFFDINHLYIFLLFFLGVFLFKELLLAVFLLLRVLYFHQRSNIVHDGLTN
jgi:hypothetical protein